MPIEMRENNVQVYAACISILVGPSSGICEVVASRNRGLLLVSLSHRSME